MTPRGSAVRSPMPASPPGGPASRASRTRRNVVGDDRFCWIGTIWSPSRKNSCTGSVTTIVVVGRSIVVDTTDSTDVGIVVVVVVVVVVVEVVVVWSNPNSWSFWICWTSPLPRYPHPEQDARRRRPRRRRPSAVAARRPAVRLAGARSPGGARCAHAGPSGC